jgi:hypothetical protein
MNIVNNRQYFLMDCLLDEDLYEAKMMEDPPMVEHRSKVPSK